ncbi:MAG: PKD domain-containing protein [Methanotrichaceae archaeon]|nr:PKD domain-containing protein [Methanotrichaceae archaeon]
MKPEADVGRLALALPGILGGAFAIFIGCLVLLFSLPSLGREGYYGFLMSPAAGAVIYILLGLLGMTGAACGAKAVRAHSLAGAASLLGLAGAIILALFQEWAACAALMALAALCWAAVRAGKGPILLLLAGLSGFPLGQAAMNFLPYGWKTWAISGTLMTFGFILQAGGDRLRLLPLWSQERGPARTVSCIFYPLLGLLLLFSIVAALIQVPAEDSTVDVRVEGNSSADSLWCFGGSGGAGPNLSDCDCRNDGQATASEHKSVCGGDGLNAKILSPGDVTSHPRGEPVTFQAAACGEGPFRFRWESSIDGSIGEGERLEKSNLSPGQHNITLTVADSTGAAASAWIVLRIAEPWICANVSPRPQYYPLDTPCRDLWPNGSRSCQQFEVCHPGLDYIVAEAVDCCDGTPTAGSACSFACQNAGGDKKMCRGLYIIKSFGPDARYMKGYALFKACCSGYPECTRTCGRNLAGTCSFREGFNQNVSRLSCFPGVWGVDSWRSDANLSQNSASLGLLPAHATVNILQTGVCADYSAAVVTALRKAGYGKEEALYTASTGYDLPLLGDHPGHAYGLAELSGDGMYHFVDTTGNGEGINLRGLPHYFWFTGCFLGQPVKIRVFDWWVGYCSQTSNWGYNDAGAFRTPDNSRIVGCSALAGNCSS